MLLMFEKEIRGGVSTIPARYSKANNKYMGEKFDSTQESKFVVYLEANNLYGWAMEHPLPVGNFEWMTENEFENWFAFSTQEGKGCILEVDLEIPEHLHDLFNDLPLAPEGIKINGVEKRDSNLWDKNKYVIHHKNLKLCIKMGAKVAKIHRGVSFDEKAWMKPYIELNA